MGPDNVANEYIIDPSVTFDPYAGAPLYVQDLVLFPSGSAEIDPQFTPLLDLGIMLFDQNPQVTITVIGHTDSQGNDFDNLALSQERVQAVLNYWTRAGVDPGRITIIGKGEAEPVDDNATSEGRQFNRRVEFIIAGLLAD
jgi:outer membrane protein OmpA-like peptidoglycan-associated protein